MDDLAENLAHIRRCIRNNDLDDELLALYEALDTTLNMVSMRDPEMAEIVDHHRKRMNRIYRGEEE